MFLNITDKDEAENKGSSAKLVHYLDKETRLIGPGSGSEKLVSGRRGGRPDGMEFSAWI